MCLCKLQNIKIIYNKLRRKYWKKVFEYHTLFFSMSAYNYHKKKEKNYNENMFFIFKTKKYKYSKK